MRIWEDERMNRRGDERKRERRDEGVRDEGRKGWKG